MIAQILDFRSVNSRHKHARRRPRAAAPLPVSDLAETTSDATLRQLAVHEFWSLSSFVKNRDWREAHTTAHVTRKTTAVMPLYVPPRLPRYSAPSVCARGLLVAVDDARTRELRASDDIKAPLLDHALRF